MVAGCNSGPAREPRSVDIANAARAAEARIDAYGRQLRSATPAPRPSPPIAAPSASPAIQGTAIPTVVLKRYRCADGTTIDARFDNAADTVVLRWGEQEVALAGQPHADGIAYAGEGWTLRGKGREATLTDAAGTELGCIAED